MEQILDAATRVVERVGYERATTNAIAAEAGISPGSLYQYYSDKEAIASALWERYAVGLREAHAAVMATVDPEGAPLDQVLDAMVDPLYAFKMRHRAFTVLFAQAGAPSGLEAVEEANERFGQQVVDVLAARNPDHDPRDLRNCAAMVFAIFRAVITMPTVTGDPDVDLLELKAATRSYLAAKGLH